MKGWDMLSRIQQGESIGHYETVRRRKDGTLLDISLTVSLLLDALGRIVGASQVARDIAERVRAEEALRRWNEELEARVERTDGRIGRVARSLAGVGDGAESGRATGTQTSRRGAARSSPTNFGAGQAETRAGKAAGGVCFRLAPR